MLIMSKIVARRWGSKHERQVRSSQKSNSSRPRSGSMPMQAENEARSDANKEESPTYNLQTTNHHHTRSVSKDNIVCPRDLALQKNSSDPDPQHSQR